MSSEIVYEWCLGCRRVSSYDDCMKNGGCPYCDSNLLTGWDMVSSLVSSFPAVPVIGKEYKAGQLDAFRLMAKMHSKSGGKKK